MQLWQVAIFTKNGQKRMAHSLYSYGRLLKTLGNWEFGCQDWTGWLPTYVKRAYTSLPVRRGSETSSSGKYFMFASAGGSGIRLQCDPAGVRKVWATAVLRTEVTYMHRDLTLSRTKSCSIGIGCSRCRSFHQCRHSWTQRKGRMNIYQETLTRHNAHIMHLSWLTRQQCYTLGLCSTFCSHLAFLQGVLSNGRLLEKSSFTCIHILQRLVVWYVVTLLARHFIGPAGPMTKTPWSDHLWKKSTFNVSDGARQSLLLA